MRISYWSSDVCSSDLSSSRGDRTLSFLSLLGTAAPSSHRRTAQLVLPLKSRRRSYKDRNPPARVLRNPAIRGARHRGAARPRSIAPRAPYRSEEHTSELQSLMRISYAVFCLKKKK